MYRTVYSLFFCLLGVLPATAQFISFGSPPKTVVVRIAHPPTTGLTVKRLAFGTPNGPCSDELLDRLVLPDFRNNHVDVIERQHLDQILAEHAFSRGQEVSQQDEIALGHILGPSILIFIKTYECRVEKQPITDTSRRNLNGTVHLYFISKTRFSLSGSVESVNLATGQVVGSTSFKSEQEKENENDSGQPEYPTEDEVKDAAMHDATAQIHRVFFPWEDAQQLPFYDDKDCGLKDLFGLYTRGDHDGALKQADADLEQCKSRGKQDKVMARAYYDAGLNHLLHADYDTAADLFNQAMQSKGADGASKALNLCHEAQSAQHALKEYLARVAQIPDPSPIAPGGPPPAAASAQSAPSAPASTPADGSSNNSSKATPEQRLKKLDQLLKQGLITQKEYQAKKQAILNEL
jgi:hypothetical protein